MPSTTASPSHSLVTDDDHSSLINVISWLLMVITSLAIIARLGTRWAMSKTFGIDDFLILVAMLFVIAQSICTSLAVSHDYGKAISASDQTYEQSKFVYAFTIFFFLSQSFSMLSVTMLVRSISPAQLHKQLGTGLLVAIILWTIVTFFGLIFQCRPPKTWDFANGECFDRLAFLTFVETCNLVLDAALIFLPAFITWSLQLMQRRRKITVIVCFCGRALVMVAIIAQLIVVYSDRHSGDPFFAWPFALTTSIAQTLAIISACIPYLRPFLASLDSGMIANDDMRRRGQSSGHSSASRKLKETLSFRGYGDEKRSGWRSRSTRPKKLDDSGIELGGEGNETRIMAGGGAGRSSEQGSQSSTAAIIRTTTVYGVDAEGRTSSDGRA